MPSLLPNFKKNPILSGALVLTAAGFLSRIVGFFYRIFLSQRIGAEGMGVYQLIFPVFGICFSLCCGPVQTAVSRYVAAQNALDIRPVKTRAGAYAPESVLKAGLLLSFSLACACAALLYAGSEFIADRLLLEARCGRLLRLMSLTVPICSVHCCISGYYYGLQRASVPAFAQLAEQAARVLSVFLVCSVLAAEGRKPTAAVAVWGMVCGEAASLLFSGTAFLFRRRRQAPSGSSLYYLPKILALAVPLAVCKIPLELQHAACVEPLPFSVWPAFHIVP